MLKFKILVDHYVSKFIVLDVVQSFRVFPLDGAFENALFSTTEKRPIQTYSSR